MGAVAAIISGVTAITSAAQSFTAAKDIKGQGRYEQQVAEENAVMAERQAKDALDRGAISEQQYRQQIRGLIGSQRASLAGQGVDVSQGSAVDLQGDTARLGELDALTIRNNAAREAWGFEVDASNSRRSGVLAGLAARNQANAARWEGVNTLITGAANSYGLYQQYRTPKAKPTSTPVIQPRPRPNPVRRG